MKVKLANKKWRTYASIDPAKNLDKVNCYSCEYCDEDGSCPKEGVFIPEVGPNIWRFCNAFMLNSEYDSDENRDRVRKYWRGKDKSKFKKPSIVTTYQLDEETAESKSIEVGSTVKVFNYKFGEEEEYEIVASGQGDPVELKLSNDSAFIKAMAEKRPGESFTVFCEEGNYECRLLAIEAGTSNTQ